MIKIIHILKGKLNKKEMAKFTGVNPRELDITLERIADQGFIKYEKVKGGKYQFILYPEPVRELEIKMAVAV